MQICGCFLSCCGVASNSPGSLKYPLMALFQAELASPHFHVAVIIIDGKKILSILFSFVLNSAIGPLLFFFLGGGLLSQFSTALLGQQLILLTCTILILIPILVCGFSNNTKQFFKTDWVSYNRTQL